MATEYGLRLKHARKQAGLTQMQLSSKTGIAQSTISSAETEGLGSAETPMLARACGVNAYWLATGEGDMQADNAPVAALEKLNEVLELRAKLQALSADARERAAVLLQGMARDPNGPWANWLTELLQSPAAAQEVTTPQLRQVHTERPSPRAPSKYSLGDFDSTKPQTPNVRNQPTRVQKPRNN